MILTIAFLTAIAAVSLLGVVIVICNFLQNDGLEHVRGWYIQHRNERRALDLAARRHHAVVLSAKFGKGR